MSAVGNANHSDHADDTGLAEMAGLLAQLSAPGYSCLVARAAAGQRRPGEATAFVQELTDRVGAARRRRARRTEGGRGCCEPLVASSTSATAPAAAAVGTLPTALPAGWAALAPERELAAWAGAAQALERARAALAVAQQPLLREVARLEGEVRRAARRTLGGVHRARQRAARQHNSDSARCPMLALLGVELLQELLVRGRVSALQLRGLRRVAGAFTAGMVGEVARLRLQRSGDPANQLLPRPGGAGGRGAEGGGGGGGEAGGAAAAPPVPACQTPHGWLRRLHDVTVHCRPLAWTCVARAHSAGAGGVSWLLGRR